MEVKIGGVYTINNKIAVVTEVLDASQSKKQRCWIQQEGEKYCVFISDLREYKDS